MRVCVNCISEQYNIVQPKSNQFEAKQSDSKAICRSHMQAIKAEFLRRQQQVILSLSYGPHHTFSLDQ